MNTKEILEAARERISDEANWCVGTVENNKGQNCALGAISKVATGQAWLCTPAVDSAMRALSDVLPGNEYPEMKISIFNNTRGHDCVMAAFDAAIEKAREQEMATC